MCASLFISGWLADTWWTAACVVDRHQFDPPFAERRPGRVSAATPAPKYRGVERERGSRGSRRAEHHERQLGHAQASCFLWLLLIPKTMRSGGWNPAAIDRRLAAARLGPPCTSREAGASFERYEGGPASTFASSARSRCTTRSARSHSAGASNAPCSRCSCCMPTRPSRSSGSSTSSGRTRRRQRDEERAGA